MRNQLLARRDFIHLSLAGGLVLASNPARALAGQRGTSGARVFSPTPSNTLGPFYKPGAPRAEKLTRIGDRGTPLLVRGRVINTQGRAIANAAVEVFHSDDHGNYDMQGFHFRGEIPVRAAGEYQFESIIPGQYGGRAQHVHYVITAPGYKKLITQLYFENDPKFEGNPDRNFNRDDLVWHRELIRPVSITRRNNLNYAAVEFNICLETV